jgi:4-amino-4-deoxy-L-arabinose transferase-like glycosyltransferase
VTAAAVTLARIGYQVFLSPYELVADEAQYWDWSRRLSASYYSKGPGIAWLIRASTSLFGTSEWAVRLPATLAFGVTMVVAARLAMDWSPEPAQARRAAVVATLLIVLLPAYQLSALLMTTDAPYIACWTLAAWTAWRAYVGERDARPSIAAWAGCGAAIGLGFLFKYSMLAILPGLALFVWHRRRVARRGASARMLAAIIPIALALVPVIAWNVEQDGAGLRHLLGYLEASGGDRAVRDGVLYRPTWTLSLIAAQCAIVGPMLLLMAIATARAWRQRSDAARLAILVAAPLMLIVLVTTLRAPVEGNWPMAAYVTLTPLAASIVLDDRPIAARLWRATIAYGVVALAAIHAPLAVAALPAIGRYVPTLRFRGAADRARAVDGTIQEVRAAAGPRMLIVATSHNAAGLLAFYLPGRPVVASAGRALGDRPSAYDFFPDTNLSGDATRGRPAVLIGGTADRWTARVNVGEVTLRSAVGPVFSTPRMDGPRGPA